MREPWLPTLLLVCYFSASSGSDISWTVASLPAVIGKNLTLACSVRFPINPVSWHRGESDEVRDLISIEGVTSNNKKYEIQMDKDEKISWYNLTIISLDIFDIGKYYRCSNGDNSWDVQMLNFKEFYLISIPATDDITIQTRMEEKVTKVTLTIDRIYPKPICYLQDWQANTHSQPVQVLSAVYGRYKIEINFAIQPCSRRTLSCELANDIVVKKTFNGLNWNFPQCRDSSLEKDSQSLQNIFILFVGFLSVVYIFYYARTKFKSTT